MSEAETVAELTRAATLQPAIFKDQDGREFRVVPEGMNAKDIDRPDYAEVPPPALIAQGVTVQTTDSLVDYVNRFKRPETVLFADIAANAIVAVIDYHGPEQAARLKHSARLALPYSIEWKTWSDMDGKLSGQLEFARFLEENGGDISAPDGATVLEACRDLQAKRNVNFKKAVRTASDNEDFEYSVETEAKGKGSIEVPSKFELTLPVYFGGETTKLFAFLRWKLSEEGGLSLGVRLHRAEHVRQAVFAQIVADVGARTEQPVVFGRPS